MLAREQLLKRIAEHLSRLSVQTELLGKIHFFDLNIAAEHFYASLLNQVYGCDLVNLNHAQMNAAAIDLADQSRSLAVQVTSQRSAQKIKKTLDKFAKHGLGTSYTTLKIVIIGKRTGTYSTVSVPTGVAFDGKADVIDNVSLIKDVSLKSVRELQCILDLMESELNYSQAAASIMDKTDKDALLCLRNLMDRSAFQDPWDLEVSYPKFRSTITDLIETINTGRSEGVLITKPRFVYEDHALAEHLNALCTQLRALRQLFQLHVKSGEIDLNANACKFHIPESGAAFDAQRNAIIAGFNAITAPYGLKPLPNIS
ncbi:SMEK domain-containing protein [Pseudomonas azotoformans]|uniref:SMEK domain-containing protein n=1 Tax=Pseudomonas azotoformans TaxID=47878 RepID=A0A127I200_PSEAZ|nr:SMEK domain-containing protein [Pseudomonas azotoformans]AMN80884.1 hypothetical protein AYR47_22390 [Pseudomonas azotoformans]